MIPRLVVTLQLRAFAVFAFFAALPLTACDCGDGGVTMVGEDAGMGRCVADEDCPDRNACNVAVGICYPLDECSDEVPCPQDNQLCEDSDGDGFFECVFERCMEDEECSELTCTDGLVAACINGGCICGEPCNGGCPGGQGCCVPTEECIELPAECEGLECPPGQFVTVTSSGAWDTGQCEFLGEACACEILPPLPIGDVGLYSGMAVNDRGAYFSAYNIDYGDLMYGAGRLDGTIEWFFVDGVPTSTESITGDINGPRGGNSGPGPDVGLHTDIALGADESVHIAYQDRDMGALRYARLNVAAGGSNHLVNGIGIGDTGLYSSLALRIDGRPAIAYLSAREVRAGFRFSTLWLAFATTATPTQTVDWSFRQIANLPLAGFGCEDRCNVEEVCLSGDQSCAVPDDPSNCNPTCMGGQRCIGGVCTPVESLPPFRDLPIARGLWPSLQVLPDGSAMIAYYDRFEGNLKIAQIEGTDWNTGMITTTIIDGNGAPNGSTNDAGLFPSLFVTPGGEIHLSYMNADRQALWYRNLNADLTSFVAEEVEEGLSMGSGPDGVLIGADSALVVDALDRVRIAYQDATNGDLKYARRDPNGQWTILVLAGDETPYRGSFGFYTDQALGPDRQDQLVSTYRYFLSAPGGPDNGLEVINPP